MNQRKRKKLREAIRTLASVRNVVETVRNEEQVSLDQIPENLKDSERSAAMEDAIDALDEAIENIDSASESIHNAC